MEWICFLQTAGRACFSWAVVAYAKRLRRPRRMSGTFSIPNLHHIGCPENLKAPGCVYLLTFKVR